MVATARPGVDPAEIEHRLQAHLDRVREHGPESTDLQRATNTLLTSIARRSQTLDRRADLLSEYTTFFDDPTRLDGDTDRYEAVRSSDLRNLLADFFAPDRRATVTVVPTEAG